MRLKTLCASLVVAGLAAACGGDGGESSSTPTPPTSSTVTLQGVAAKGVLGQARVSVHPVKADGSVDTATTLATALSKDDGTYTLPSFTATPGAVYVVRITAEGGKTFTVDEITKAQVVLPDTFVMRGLLVAPSTATASVVANVTPFSELAVAAAADATGGVTATNAQQALANVRVLLGFDPGTTTPMTIQDAKTPEQQVLAVMLTAVAKLANESELGCTAADLGARTQCVVDKLSDSASIDSTKPGTVGGVDIAARLVASATDVVNTPELVAGSTVTPGTLDVVKDNLEGDGTVVKPGTADAIAAANALFDGLRSDAKELFSKGGVSSLASGAVNKEAYKFQEAMEGVQAPVEMLLKDVGALTLGVDLYLDYKRNGGAVTRTRGSAEDIANGSEFAFPGMGAIVCSLYQDEAANTLATAPANANYIGCGAVYYVQRVFTSATTSTLSRWRHGFTITPQTDGTFTYGGRARLRVENCSTTAPCTLASNEPLQPNSAGVTGTVTPTVTAGRITAFKIQGDLAGMFDDGGKTLVNEKTTIDLSGTRVIGSDNMSSSTLQGSAVSYDTAGAKLSTLTVKSGSLSEVAVSWDANDQLVARNAPTAVSPAGGDIATAALDVVWATPSAEFEGGVSLTESVWDKTLTTHIPTQGKLTGALRNIDANGVKSEFFSGSITAGITNFAQYDATVDDSATNNFGISLAVAGTVTAPSRPKLQLTGSTSLKSHEERPASVALTYKSIVGDTPKRQVSLNATRGADGKYTVKLSEAASNISMTYVEDAETADILSGTEKIGVFTNRDKLITWSNKTQVSLDFGL